MGLGKPSAERQFSRVNTYHSHDFGVLGLVIACLPTGTSIPWIDGAVGKISSRGIPMVMANRGGRDRLGERPQWISADTLNPQ